MSCTVDLFVWLFPVTCHVSGVARFSLSGVLSRCLSVMSFVDLITVLCRFMNMVFCSCFHERKAIVLNLAIAPKTRVGQIYLIFVVIILNQLKPTTTMEELVDQKYFIASILLLTITAVL